MNNQKEIESLGTEFPKELDRCRELLGIYRSVGASGRYVIQALGEDIAEAEKAQAGGDVAAMLRSYRILKGWKK